jgi:hypothetical protein
MRVLHLMTCVVRGIDPAIGHQSPFLTGPDQHGPTHPARRGQKRPSSRSLVAGILVLVALAVLVLSLSGFLTSIRGAALVPVLLRKNGCDPFHQFRTRWLLGDVANGASRTPTFLAEVAQLQREDRAAAGGGSRNPRRPARYARSNPDSRYLRPTSSGAMSAPISARSGSEAVPTPASLAECPWSPSADWSAAWSKRFRPPPASS